jgi:transketolase
MKRKGIEEAALTARLLSIDAIERAKSGHPGLPLGCAELGVLIYGEILKHYPRDPRWINRDRFILSAGHGSALLYSLLFLSGYDLTLDDLKNFRQVASKTPGHPEYGDTAGVETTTGPLGQGFGNAVGMAIAERMLSARFNTERYKVIDHYTFVLASDGDLMEGVSSEAASIAGHQGLGKLIVFYDDNRVTIDGKADLAFSEDVLKRFEAYHWQTLSGDAYDRDEVIKLVEEAKKETEMPSLIKLRSVIGKGSPNLAGSHKAHGGSIGEEEIRRTKSALGVSEDVQFYVSKDALRYFHGKRLLWVQQYQNWQDLFSQWKMENPDLYRQWVEFFKTKGEGDLHYHDYQPGEKLATRLAGGNVIDRLLQRRKNLVGGCADLTVPCFGDIANIDSFQKHNPLGNFIYYGIREHAMGSITNGLALHGGLRPYCATFLVFSDYMRPSIRLAAMMKLPVIYVFTHDSVLIGQDGPTHQPVEHLAALRIIPGLTVIRPADAEETEIAWSMALANHEGPTVIALTRQELEVFEKKDPNWRNTMRRGAYIVKDSQDVPELAIVATGSEVQAALQVWRRLPDRKLRVISMPCRELFLSQNQQFREKLLPEGIKKVVIEAAVPCGWERLFVPEAPILGIKRFGLSGPGPQVGEALGIGSDALLKKVEKELG